MERTIERRRCDAVERRRQLADPRAELLEQGRHAMRDVRQQAPGHMRDRPDEMAPIVDSVDLGECTAYCGANDARRRNTTLLQQRQHLLLSLQQRTFLERVRNLE